MLALLELGYLRERTVKNLSENEPRIQAIKGNSGKAEAKSHILVHNKMLIITSKEQSALQISHTNSRNSSE
jgi:hypothetical protein